MTTVGVIGLGYVGLPLPGVDHDLIARRARLVVDLRGVTRATRSANVPRL